MNRRHSQNEQGGFTVVEVLVSLFVVTILVGMASRVAANGLAINTRTTKQSEADSLAFKKVQDYINVSFDNIPVGDATDSYEIEDFSTEAQAIGLKNADAKVYIVPESTLNTTSSTITTNFSQTIAADTAFVSGSEVQSIDVDDATGDWYRDWRMDDDNYYNYTYSRYASSPNNLASPSIDLGSPQSIDFIRVDWYGCGYGANDFRVEAKNSSPNNNGGWTTIASGLSDNGIPCNTGSHPQDIDVSSNSTDYRYWRLFFVDAQNNNYAVISELEAFSSGSPGDTVEQQGADASNSPGALFFSSSDLEMAWNGSSGQQSVGMIFDTVNSEQGSIIDSAFLEFTADESDSGSVTLKVSAADVDSASPWLSTFAVDLAVDSDNSDGSTGTSATVNWAPGAWSPGENGNDTRVDVTAIVQELVDRPGWVTGNDMAFAVQYVSGSSKRVAERSPAPALRINWSESTTTTTTGGYVDDNLDGDVDNPTLVRVRVEISYEVFGQPEFVSYETYVRKFGVGN